MKKILFPTDFSQAASNAFDYALELANIIDAKIDLIHIYSISFNDASALPYHFIQQQIDEKVASVNKQFDTLLEGKNRGLVGQIKNIYGIFPAMEIVDFAEKYNYDCIIMGTKGRSNRLDQLMGSITSRVIMKANCPIIAIPSEARFLQIDQIAYATTMEPKDASAVKQLMDFAGKQQASVHFVHVNTRSNEGIQKGVLTNEASPNLFIDFTIINNFSVINGLNEYLENNDIDLLALYIPQRRLWERIFHQSVTKRMALHTQIPLLVFHE